MGSLGRRVFACCSRRSYNKALGEDCLWLPLFCGEMSIMPTPENLFKTG